MATFPLPLTGELWRVKIRPTRSAPLRRTSLPAGDPIGVDNDLLLGVAWHATITAHQNPDGGVGRRLACCCGGNSQLRRLPKLTRRPRDAHLVHVVRLRRGKERWLHVADLVTQKYPNIKIQFETTPFEDYWTKLTTQAASGATPCVIGLQGQRAPQFGNLLVPLDDYMSQAGVKAADYVPSITKNLQFEGKQVALPYDVGPFIMFYNKDAFKAAGLKEPAIGWTTDDFMADAKALTKPPKYGFFAGSDIGMLLPWVLSSSGKSAVNAEGKLDVDNPEWHASAQWYTDLVSKERWRRRSRARGPLPLPPTSSWPVTRTCRSTVRGRSSTPGSRPSSRSASRRCPRAPAAPRPGLTDPASGSARSARTRRGVQGHQCHGWSGGGDIPRDAGRAYPALISTQNSWYEGNKTQDVKPVMDASLESALPYATTPTWQQVVTTFSKQAVATSNGQGSVDDLLSQTQAAGE